MSNNSSITIRVAENGLIMTVSTVEEGGEMMGYKNQEYVFSDAVSLISALAVLLGVKVQESETNA